MNLVTLHQGLFGRTPRTTVRALRVTLQQRRLYKAFPNARGFSLTSAQARVWKNEFQLTAALVVALAQARIGEDREVFLFLPEHYREWVMGQIKKRAQYVIACQVAANNPECGAKLREMIGQLSIHSGFGEVNEPTYWAAFGFCSEGALPDWIGQRLIKASG